MKKIRELLKDNRWKWTAGGAACLVAASIGFSSMPNIGVRADEISLGTETVDLERVSGEDHTYWIETAEQLRKIGNATEGTANLTFKLKNDITFSSVTTPAAGIFEGTFDGEGHVVIFEDVNITVTDEVESNESVMNGLLFGSVSGNVEDLIVDIRDTDASYTRKTKNPSIPAVADPVYEENQNPIIGEKESVTGLSSDETELAKVEEIFGMDTVSGTDYKTQTLKENGTVTTTYTAADPSEDYFGVICGNISGNVQQIYLAGNTLTVSREELTTLNYSQSVQSGYREEVYYYLQETDSRTGEELDANVSLAGTVYATNITDVQKVSDQALSVKVSSPKAAAKGEVITYQVTVQNQEDTAYTIESVKTTVEGSWKEEFPITVAAGASKDLYFYCGTSEITGTDLAADFTVTAFSEQTVVSTKVSDIHVQLFETAGGASDESKQGLNLHVSAPSVVEKGNDIHYNVVMKNIGLSDYDQLTLKAEDAQGKSWNVMGTETPVELLASGEKQLNFTYPAENAVEGQVVLNFIAEAKNTTTGEEVKAIVSNVATQMLEISQKSWEKRAEGAALKVTAVNAQAIGENLTEVRYKLSVTNTGNKSANVSLTSTKQGEWKIGSYDGKTMPYTIENLPAKESRDIFFIYTASEEDIRNGRIVMDFTAERAEGQDTVKVAVKNVEVQLFNKETQVSKISRQGLGVDIAAPTAAVKGTNMTADVTVINLSNTPFENIKLEVSGTGVKNIVIPEGFTLGANADITKPITFSVDENAEEVVLNITATGISQVIPQEGTLKDSSAVTTMLSKVEIPLIDSSVQTSDSSTAENQLQMIVHAPKEVKKGDTIQYKVELHNKGNAEARNLKLDASVRGEWAEGKDEIDVLKAGEEDDFIFNYSPKLNEEKVTFSLSGAFETAIQFEKVSSAVFVSKESKQESDDGFLKMTVYSPDKVKKGESITYRVVLEQIGDREISKVKVTGTLANAMPGMGGHWWDPQGWSENQTVSLENGSATLSFPYTPAEYETLAELIFVAEEIVESASGEGMGSIIRVSSASTSFEDCSNQTLDAENETIRLDVTQPKAVKLGEDLVYKVKVTNKSALDLENIIITADAPNGQWVGTQPSQAFSLKTTKFAEFTYVCKPEAEGEWAGVNFTAAGNVVVKENQPEPLDESVIKLNVADVTTKVIDSSPQTWDVLRDGLYAKVSVAKEAVKGEPLVYTLDLKNTTDRTFYNIAVEANEKGTWSFENAIVLGAGQNEKVTFTVDTTKISKETVDVLFSVSAKHEGSEGGVEIEFTTLKTKLYDLADKTAENVIDGLNLKVYAPDKANAKSGDKITYRMTVENTSDRTFENIQLTAAREGKWTSGASQQSGTLYEITRLEQGKTATVEFEITLTANDIAAKKVSADISAQGSNGNGETKVMISGVETLLMNAEEQTTVQKEQGLQMHVQAPKAAKKGEEVQYQVTITNMGEGAYTELQLKASKEGTWKEEGSFALLAGEAKVFNFTCTAGSGDEEVVDFSVTAKNTETSEEVQAKISNIAVSLVDAAIVSQEEKIPGLELKIDTLQTKRNDESENMEYLLTVTNTSEQDYSGIVLKADKSGEWNHEGTNKETYQIEMLEKGSSVEIPFVINDLHAGFIRNEIAVNFTATVAVEDTTMEVHSSELKTKILEEKPDSMELEVANGLKAIIQVEDSNILEGEDFQYTLILENTNKLEKRYNLAKDLQILTELSEEGWILENSDTTAFSVDNVGQQVLTAGEKITLKKTVAKPVEGNGISNIHIETLNVTSALTEKAYRYTYDSEVKTPELKDFVSDGQAPVNSGAAIVSGNLLYTGGVAGKLDGTAREIKQSINLRGNEETELAIGGIAGKTENPDNWSHFYMLGQVNDVAKYESSGTALPVNSATSEEEAQALAGTEGWTSYGQYAAGGENFEEETMADLEWLVKTENTEEVYFEFAEPEMNAISVKINDQKKLTDQKIEYVITYNARRSMNDETEDSVYKSEDGMMELGASGYYRLLRAYATDGYYHYRIPKCSIGEAEWVYPYSETKDQNPYVITEQSVIRSATNPLEDQIQIQFSNATGGTVYYEATYMDSIPNMGASSGTQITEIDGEGKVRLPFAIDNIRYRIVPMVGGHIYPTLTTKEFSQSDREPLPKPTVSCYEYYDVYGKKKEYAPFGADSYEAGTDMLLLPAEDEINNETYNFRYVYSAVQPGEGWDEEQRYIGNDRSFMNGAVDYVDSAVIPEELVGQEQVYLYVEMSKKNYDSQFYYFGPFAVTKGDKIEATVVSNGKVIEGFSVLDGDRVMISSTLEGAELQYAVSKAPTASWEWKLYPEEGISMKQEQGGYVYARIKYSEDKYSKEVLFDYTFGGICADPRVTPNTGLSINGADAAATVGAATNVTLSSRTPNAEIFYAVSETTQMLQMERALELPGDVEADGTISVDGYKYFKVGNRWYRTSNIEVERYVDGVVLSHAKKGIQFMYLSAIAMAEGYESSAALEYVYKVQPVQQVSNPEGAFETRHMPGGEETEVANVTLGASLSFFSVTPEAKLYYELGSGTDEPSKEMPLDGIVVEGTYGGNFVVRVQAKKEGMLDSEIVTFVYAISDQELASAPTATPGTSADVPTTVIPGNKILLSTVTKEAFIFYTTDGSSPKVNENEDGTFTPGNESTKLYDPNAGIVMPAEGAGYFSITAVTVRADLAKSAEAHFIYVYPGAVLKPYANIDSGKVEQNAVVILKNLTEDAVIYYNVAYGEEEPEEPTISSSVFSESYPFTITQKTTIKAIAAKNGVKSEVATFIYEPMERLAAPEASIASGSVVSRGTVLELKSIEGATIYYTMDGSDPTDSVNGAVMSGSTLTLNGEEGGQLTIKAYAMAENRSQSEVATFTYQFSQSAGGVTASIESGSLVSNGTKVNLMSDVSDAAIYYTTNGSSPVEHGRNGTIVEINGTPGGSVTVKAVAIANNTPGTVATFIYKIKERPTEPTASPAGGTLTVATRVSLSSSAEEIYYTTDGTEPTKSSTLYTEPILINRTTVLKAIAVSQDGEISEVSTFVYTAAEKAAAVTATEKDGATLLPGTEVKLSTSTEHAEIYYSTDGTEPTLDNLDSLLIYDGEALEIHRSVTIQAVAYREDLRLSDVTVWNYSVDIIPAQQLKEEEAAKEAEEGLRDTDASNLERNTDASGELIANMLRESVNGTRVSYKDGVLPEQLNFETIKEENSPLAVEKAKAIFGNEQTVLETYEFRVKQGTSPVQPKENVEIAIPIPKGYEDAVLTIAYVEEGHNLTTLETSREIGMLYAKTMKLGSYVVIGPEREIVEENVFSYLILVEAAAAMALAAGIIFMIKEKSKKRRKKK